MVQGLSAGAWAYGYGNGGRKGKGFPEFHEMLFNNSALQVYHYPDLILSVQGTVIMIIAPCDG
jgi:hypothetical protein